MRKILSNIVALAVLIVGILFCCLLYLTMVFFLMAIVKMNCWLAFVISGSIVSIVAYVYGSVAKELGVKLELKK